MEWVPFVDPECVMLFTGYAGVYQRGRGRERPLAIKGGGPFAASAAQYPQKMAVKAVEKAIESMQGKKLKDFIAVRGSLVTKDTLAEYPGWKE